MGKPEYLVQGAKLECSGCVEEHTFFMMGNINNIAFANLPMGNQKNTEVGVDILPFGQCTAKFATIDKLEEAATSTKDSPIFILKPRMCKDFIELEER